MKIKKCFIIMPFSRTKSITSKEQWDEIYKELFVPAWKEFNFECERTDVPRGSITSDIIEKLFSADIVFADLTDTNPNVMYELGVRHAFQKPSMIVKMKGSKIPFDVKDYRVYEYLNTPKGFKDLKRNISKVIEDINIYPERSDNPVWDFLYYGGFMVDYYSTIETTNKLIALKEEIYENLKGFKEFEKSISKKKKKEFEDKKGRIKTEFAFLMGTLGMDCLILLKTTQYTTFPEGDWNTLKTLYSNLRAFLYSSIPLIDPWTGVSLDKKVMVKLLNEVISLMELSVQIIKERIKQIVE